MQQQFMGLTMPVFTAFGWAGEEQALAYALSQLEEFIGIVHASLPRRVQTHLPHHGLNQDNQAIYLAANQNPGEDVYVAYYARPLSLELQLALEDEEALKRTWKSIAAVPQRWLALLHELGPGWDLQVKQMQVDEDTGQRTSYQELYKDEVTELDAEKAEALSERASFLNSEPQWVVPFYLSRRWPSEQISAMSLSVISVMVDEIRELVPLLDLITGKEQLLRKNKAKKQKDRVRRAPTASEIDHDTQFVYVTELKPLHLRKGFVNLTPEHWSFFAESARATTRDVTVSFDEHIDKNSAVWRLASNDMARVVLSEAVRDWLQANFDPDDEVRITATRQPDSEIELILEPAI